MRAYAGIGSRKTTAAEQSTIYKLSAQLSQKFIVYSGNANGSDVIFQRGSSGKCVVFLPYYKFNIDRYDAWKHSMDCYVVGDSEEGIKAANELHPAPHNLNWKSMPMMARNYHQIMGYDSYPAVQFVVCCASRDKNGDIIGGTGQACRIAIRENIPVINIRDDNWNKDLNECLTNIIKKDNR